MTGMHYKLATTSWDEREHEAMQSVIASGQYTMGARVAEFERDFASLIGSEHCVMVNSGSSANLLMIAALKHMKTPLLHTGDEVLVPAVSWPTTYYPLQQYGLRMRFVDIDLDTLNYDLDALRGAITPRTRAIMVVNLLGNPNDFAAIRAIIGDRDITIIEDNCESLGATFDGRQAGSFGLMGTFSTFFSHHISTMEGGVIATNDEELYHILLSLRAHGWTRNLPKHNRVTGRRSDDSFTESFKFVLPGYNVRPLELSGAIGVEQLRKVPAIVAGRRANAERFLEMIRRIPGIIPQRELGQSSWFGFSLVVGPEAEFTRTDLVRTFDRFGIECRPIVAGNFAKNEVLRWFDYDVYGELTNAKYIDEQGLFIGNHHYPMDAEFEVLARALDALPEGTAVSPAAAVGAR